ncbi:hypothetical protein K2Y11_00320 [bacterium]|nr:hypothetical protein [bacterium]
MELNEIDIFGGLSGPRLSADAFDFGCGISISRTYSHLMAPFIMAFTAPGRNGFHPGPWRAAKGGFSFDIHAQIYVPKDFQPSEWFDRLNTVWWFVALLRFRATPFALVPVVANAPFTIPNDDMSEVHFWPIEVAPRYLIVGENGSNEITVDDLEWIKRYWWQAGKLMNRSHEFNLLFRARDQCMFMQDSNLALVSLWGALEGIFSPARTELRFRVSANIAAFMEPPGRARMDLQKQVAKLYDARSQAAHGAPNIPDEAFRESNSLTKQVLTKMIESNNTPNREELDAALLGVGVH